MKSPHLMQSLVQLLVATIWLGGYSMAAENEFGVILNSPPVEIMNGLPGNLNTEYQVNIFDGGTLQLRDGFRKGGGFSEVNLLGGTADVRVFGPDAVLNMSGGKLNIRQFRGTANVSGGMVEELVAVEGSLVRIVGGSVGAGLQAQDGSHVFLVGSDFEIDGEPIVGLNPSVPMEISVRDVGLTGIFADNSPFEFVLDSDHFSSDATLSVTLVPEPSSYIMVFVATTLLIRLTRKSRKR